MPRWIAALLLSGCLCAADFAVARADQGHFGASQTKNIPAGVAPAADILDGDILGIPREQAAVVGVSIVAGAVVLHLLVPGDFTYFAGGVFGGLAALWWYEDGGETRLRPMLNPSRAAVIHARGEPLLEGVARGR
jgi:hypothetical protein